jgi:hypothetical protein
MSWVDKGFVRHDFSLLSGPGILPPVWPFRLGLIPTAHTGPQAPIYGPFLSYNQESRVSLDPCSCRGVR